MLCWKIKYDDDDDDDDDDVNLRDFKSYPPTTDVDPTTIHAH